MSQSDLLQVGIVTKYSKELEVKVEASKAQISALQNELKEAQGLINAAYKYSPTEQSDIELIKEVSSADRVEAQSGAPTVSDA